MLGEEDASKNMAQTGLDALAPVLANAPLAGGAGCCGDSSATRSRQHIGFKKGMAIASLNVSGTRCSKVINDG